MPRIEDVLERESRTVDLEPGDFERLLDRRERKERNRRIRAGTLGVIVALAVGIIVVRSLTSGPPVDRTAQPAPGVSGALAYALDGDVYLADPDASNAVKIAAGGAKGEGCAATITYGSPSWSPDGRYLAFQRDCWSSTSDVVLDSTVMIADPEGTVVAEMPQDVRGGFIWSPDSTRVALLEPGGRPIDVYGLDGVRRASLSSPISPPPYLAWMPEGSALFVSNYEISWVVPLDGSPAYQLPGGARIYSPDGMRVALVEHLSTVVTDAAGATLWESDRRNSPQWLSPQWSPDGDRFAMVTRSDGLVLVDVASGEETVVLESGAALPKDGAFNSLQGFSPQGDRILFSALVRGSEGGFYNSLYSIGIDGSDVRLLVDGAMQAQWRPR